MYRDFIFITCCLSDTIKRKALSLLHRCSKILHFAGVEPPVQSLGRLPRRPKLKTVPASISGIETKDEVPVCDSCDSLEHRGTAIRPNDAEFSALFGRVRLVLSAHGAIDEIAAIRSRLKPEHYVFHLGVSIRAGNFPTGVTLATLDDVGIQEDQRTAIGDIGLRWRERDIKAARFNLSQ